MMQLSLRGIMKKPMSKWVVEVHLIGMIFKTVFGGRRQP